jgi:putative ABC transport system permease protein
MRRSCSRPSGERSHSPSVRRRVLAITFHDLRYRSRQFLIAVIGAGLVFAMALLLTGLAESFRTEIDNTVDAAGADAWVVAGGATGPFTAFAPLPANTVDIVAGAAGVERADPVLIVPGTALAAGETVTVRLFGHEAGGLGSVEPVEGRAAAAPGEAVVDRRLQVDIGETFTVGGSELTAVGLVEGLTLLGGSPMVYVDIDDARAIGLAGQPLVSSVVTIGVPQDLPASLTVLTDDEVRDDTQRVMADAIASVDNIVAALVYVSALERVRDFAVLKSLGSSSALLFGGVAVQAVVVTLAAAAVAAVTANFLKPVFQLPVSIPSSAFVALPIVAVVIGLVSSLVGLRRAIAIDPAQAFAGR